MHRALAMAALLLAACPGKPADTGRGELDPEAPDLDGDGYGSDVDCDDDDPAVHPGATELCNGVDDDCDGYIDDADPSVDGGQAWYEDGDGDGWGRDGDAVVRCTAPTGWVAVDGDCDDGSVAVHPGAAELCNGVDDDCDGVVDDDPVDGEVWYADADADGYGAPDLPVRACARPGGYVGDATDCDDGDASIHPGANERCDGVDEDCDGAVDEDPVDPPAWYADVDGDGYGDPTVATSACLRPGGHVADATDCDDGDATIHPGADEHCDGVDEDCDGAVDEEPVDGGAWYLDGDGDGYGDGGVSTTACGQPSGYVADGTDCDDADPAVSPGAQERCDGVDDDCDGAVDESPAVDAPTWYADVDADGYGDAGSATAACSQPSGHVADGTDCDDGDPGIHPGASESCDGIDEDCDGSVDEGAVDGSTWYADADGDGYGDAASATTACAAPSGYGSDATDCDDSDPYSHPGAAELCDGVDNDCDGSVDGGGLATWFDSAGTPTDLSGTLGAGTPSAAVTLGATRDGTLVLCPDTWYLHLEVATADYAVVGMGGSGSTVLQGDGTAPILQARSGAAVIAVEGLTLSGGWGGDGAGISGGSAVVDLTLDDVVVQDCFSYGDGGGIYLVGGSLAATDLVLDGNDAISSGGGIYLYGGTASFSGLTVTGNTAGYISGGLYLTHGPFTLDDVLISGNQSAYGGGLMGYYGTLSMSDCEVSGNAATTWGGGAYLHTASLSLDSCQIFGNQAGTSTAYGAGGGVFAYNGSSIGCIGSASETAGIYLNSAYYGGGVYLYDAYAAVVSSACDWGTSTAGDDNWWGDVSSPYFWAASFGVDASFTCVGTACY